MTFTVGNETGEIVEQVRIPTTTPEETLPLAVDFFRGANIYALGIASFGPLDLNPASQTYGSITTTPKPGWSHCPLLPVLRSGLGVPAALDTDVSAAAVAEHRIGAGKGFDDMMYISVASGLGGGLIIGGNVVHGLVHPEVGHILVRPHPKDPTPDGFCPYHRGCLEGLADRHAMEQRWGMKLEEIPPEHPAWEIEAYYLSQLCVDALSMLSIPRIVLGGPVMRHEPLLGAVRQGTQRLLNGYIADRRLTEAIEEVIVSPGLGENSAAIGALFLAADVA